MFLAVSRVFRGIMGCFRGVPGCSGGVPGVFRGVPGFTDTPSKLKGQPTNAFFAAVNQMFGGSSQLLTTAEHCSHHETFL